MEEKKKKEKQKRSTCPHSYCDVCRRNHDQGRRHRYFPSHISTFSSLLSRFSDKLSHLRPSLRNPTLLRSDPAGRSRLWCIFCSLDLVETDSLFACGNAITHLASQEHLKNVKEFLWKHGVGADMDRIDTFRVTETELAKWEKCCESLKKVPHSPEPEEQPPKDIRNNMTNISRNINDNIYCNIYSSVVLPSCSINVMPLQIATVNKNQDSKSYFGGAQTLNGEQGTCRIIAPTFPNLMDQRVNHKGDANDGDKGNVHTGAPPPWLEVIEQAIMPAPNPNFNKGRSHKLNPKRVGAAWAEKRRAELEKEKRGELVEGPSTDNWLPNFGRVWHTGTRKDSKKEFEKENSIKKREVVNMEKSEPVLEMKPYISKRMMISIFHLSKESYKPYMRNMLSAPVYQQQYCMLMLGELRDEQV